MTFRPTISALLLLVTGGLAAADNPVPMGVKIVGGDTATSPVPTNVLINQEFMLTKQHEGPGGTHSWFRLGNLTTSEQVTIIEAANSDAAKPVTHTGRMKGIQPGDAWIVAFAKIGAAEATDSKLISIVDFMELRADVACINLSDADASFHLLAKRHGTDWPEGTDVKWQRKQTDKEGGDWEDINPTTTFNVHYAEIHDRPSTPGYYLYRCKIYSGDDTWTEIPAGAELLAMRLELLEPASPAELLDHAKNKEFKLTCRARIMPKVRDIKWGVSGKDIVKFESGENGVLESDANDWRIETNVLKLDPERKALRSGQPFRSHW